PARDLHRHDVLGHPDVLRLPAGLRPHRRRPGQLDAPDGHLRLQPQHGRGPAGARLRGRAQHGAGAWSVAGAAHLVRAEGLRLVGELTWRKRSLGLWIPLALFYVVALFPFTWMAATSLKTNAELYNPKANPLWIQHPSLVHYISLLEETNFLTWVGNTMLVAVIATGISLLLGTMLAYPLARMRFRGAPLLAITVAITYLVPQSLLFVPMADLIRRMRLNNTLSAMLLTL